MKRATATARKVIAIANVPGPNLNDFYDRLAVQDGIDLEVLYCSRRTRKWREGIAASDGHRHSFAANLNAFSRYGRMQVNPGVLLRILRERDALFVVQGYSTPTLYGAMRLCRMLGRPFVYWGEAINRSNAERGLGMRLKRRVVATINAACKAFIVGTRGQDAYIALGLDPGRVATMSYSCDLSPFLAVADERAEAGRGVERTVTTTAQLIPRKRVDLLIRAFVDLAADYPDWTLKIVGEGPLKAELQAMVPEALRGRVSWLGYLPKAEHPAHHARCDIFAFPSREDGGPMSLTEAMASGLPPIATDGVFTGPDLIEDGTSGFIVPRDDLESFRDRLATLMADAPRREAMGRAAARSARNADAGAVAARFAEWIRDDDKTPSGL